MIRYPRTRRTELWWFAVAPLFLAAIIVVAWRLGHLPHGWWAAPVVTLYGLYQGSLSRLRRLAREREVRDS